MGRSYQGELRWREDPPKPGPRIDIYGLPEAQYVVEMKAVGPGGRVWGHAGAFLDAMWPLVRLGCVLEPLVIQLGSGKYRPIDEASWTKAMKQMDSARGSNNALVDASLTAGKTFASGSTTAGALWLKPQKAWPDEGESRWNPDASLPDWRLRTVGLVVAGLDGDGWLGLLDEVAVRCEGGGASRLEVSWYGRSLTPLVSAGIGYPDRFVYGVSWAQWLNAPLVEWLGGVDRVIEEAPVFSARRVGGGVVLQTTALPQESGREDLAVLAEYLRPILCYSDDDVDAYQRSIGVITSWELFEKDQAAADARNEELVPPEGRVPVWSAPQGDPEVSVAHERYGNWQVRDRQYAFGVDMRGVGTPAIREALRRAVADWANECNDVFDVFFDGEPLDGYYSFVYAERSSVHVEPNRGVELVRRLSWFSLQVAPIIEVRFGYPNLPGTLTEAETVRAEVLKRNPNAYDDVEEAAPTEVVVGEPAGVPERLVPSGWYGEMNELDLPLGVDMRGHGSSDAKDRLVEVVEGWQGDHWLKDAWFEREPVEGYYSFLVNVKCEPELMMNLDAVFAELVRRISWFSAQTAEVAEIRFGSEHEPDPAD